jgi:hypothetical protein
MERLFSPWTRWHGDIQESQDHIGDISGHSKLFQELHLDVSTEELLSAERAFTYANLHAVLGSSKTFAWLTPHSAVARGGGRGKMFSNRYRLTFKADGEVILALADSPERLLEICDVITRLMAASVVHSIKLSNRDKHDGNIFINVPGLAYLMEQCRSLKILSLVDLDMDENHCRVLGCYSRPSLEIVLNYCRFTSAGASALVEVLGRNQGPTKLDFVELTMLFSRMGCVETVV